MVPRNEWQHSVQAAGEGREADSPENNHAAGLFNGMIGTALEDGEKEKNT